MNVQDFLLFTILPVMSVAAVFVLLRLIRGPSLSDRVIALDLLAILTIGFSAVYSVASDQPAFLDVAVIIALVTFLGTVAFAYYLQKREW